MRRAKVYWPHDKEKVTKRRARKRHRCAECGGDIFPGEEYYEDRFRRDPPDWKIGAFSKPYFYVHRVCEQCWKGRRLYAK